MAPILSEPIIPIIPDPPSYPSPRDTPTIEMVSPDGKVLVRKCKANLGNLHAMQIMMGHLDPPEDNWAEDSDQEDDCPPLQPREDSEDEDDDDHTDEDEASDEDDVGGGRYAHLYP